MDTVASFQLRMKVRDYEVDSEGIVNNACYLNYFEHTRHEFCQQAGLSFGEMLRRDMSPVVRHIAVDYLLSLSSGDEFTSCLNITRKGPRFIFHQWIVNQQGQTVTSAQVTIVNLVGGKLSRGEELAEAFSRYLS